jgi:dipeptidyl aminopeptidase/acylaminoacyl peptidase
MTTPSLWTGEFGFSRDGTKMAYASLLWRSTLLRIAFDPREERTLGAPVPILKSTQPIRDHRLSPDGEWVAFMQTASQEDIALARLDGTQYRRLTDDKFRDRGPTWSPDGKEIAFYSDRGGDYQVWTIRPDGSGLRQLVQAEGAANLPVYSPDGRQMALSVIWGDTVTRTWALVDLTAAARPFSARVLETPEIKDGAFWPMSWSSDGARLAGNIVRKDGTMPGVAIYDFAKRRVEPVFESGDPFWKTPMWLSDGRRLLVRERRGISLVEIATKRVKPLLEVGGYFIGVSLGVSRDDRAITFTETATEGDVWVADLK